MSNNKFPWNCGDCPMLKTYDMSIDDLTHICLWSKKQIDDCDRYKSVECPLEKHDADLLDKVAKKLKAKYPPYFNEFGITVNDTLQKDIDEVIAEMKAEVSK